MSRLRSHVPSPVDFSNRPPYPVLPSPIRTSSQSRSINSIHVQEPGDSRAIDPFPDPGACSVGAGRLASSRPAYLLYQDSTPSHRPLSSPLGPTESTSVSYHSGQHSSIISSDSSVSSPHSHYTTTSSLGPNLTIQLQTLQENWLNNTSYSSLFHNDKPPYSPPAEDSIPTDYIPFQAPSPRQHSLPGPKNTHLSRAFHEKHPLYRFCNADLRPRAPVIASGLERLPRSLFVTIQSYLGVKDLQQLRTCNYNLYMLVNIHLAPDHTANRVKDLIYRERRQVKDTEHWGCFLCYRLLGPEHFDSNTQTKYARIVAGPEMVPGVAGGYTFTPVNIVPIYIPSTHPLPTPESLALFKSPTQSGWLNYFVNCPIGRTPAPPSTGDGRTSRATAFSQELSRQVPKTIFADERIGVTERLVTSNSKPGDIVSLRRFCITCGVESGLYPAGLRASITTRTGGQWFVCRCKVIWDLMAGKCHTCGLNAPYQSGAPSQESSWISEVNIKEGET